MSSQEFFILVSKGREFESPLEISRDIFFDSSDRFDCNSDFVRCRLCTEDVPETF